MGPLIGPSGDVLGASRVLEEHDHGALRVDTQVGLQARSQSGMKQCLWREGMDVGEVEVLEGLVAFRLAFWDRDVDRSIVGQPVTEALQRRYGFAQVLEDMVGCDDVETAYWKLHLAPWLRDDLDAIGLACMGSKAFTRLNPRNDVAFPLHHIRKFTGAGAKVEEAAGGFQNWREDRVPRSGLTGTALEMEPGRAAGRGAATG